MSAESRRKEQYNNLATFPQYKDGVVRRFLQTGYNATAGVSVGTYQGQICRLIEVAKSLKPSENKEVKKDDKQIILALSEIYATYDSSWAETSRATVAPFELNQNDTVFYNGKSHAIIGFSNQDSGDGGVYSLLIRE